MPITEGGVDRSSMSQTRSGPSLNKQESQSLVDTQLKRRIIRLESSWESFSPVFSGSVTLIVVSDPPDRIWGSHLGMYSGNGVDLVSIILIIFVKLLYIA